MTLEEKKLYNEELKERFLKQYTGNTQKYYRNILQKAFPIETALKKDIYAFNRSELNELFAEFGATSELSIISEVSIIRKYIDFFAGFVDTKTNWAATYSPKDLKRYVNKFAMRKKYITTFEQYYKNILELNNAQDGALIALIYEGARGKEEIEEIQNLKITDVFPNDNKVILTRNNGDTRELIVEDDTMELIKDAIAEKEYYKNNGQDCDVTINFLPLANSEYVFRPCGKTKTGKLKQQTLLRRIKNIANYWGNPYINVRNIWVSGMIKYAKELKKQYGKLTMPECWLICDKFGYDRRYWYNVTRWTRDYI
ncbi:MAG: hypothetical protein Q8880_12680 [Bacteroidota bacterium]|nr:hypothetical protein [Bacteroidota bacterium]